MDSEILTPLNSLENSLNALLSSLTTTNTFSNAPTAAHDLLSADDALTTALDRLKGHQQNYRRILQLRSEAEYLQNQIKDIVRTCMDLRTELGDIHPSILDDDQEEDAGTVSKEVDYNTLLAFAARIGKHNAAAAREAELESNRRRLESSKAKAVQSNGVTTNDGESTGNTTEESQAALAAINESLAFQRANVGMAFPPPDRLRMGVLGQLQLLREQQGEEAVDAEIERLVKSSESYIETEPQVDEPKNDVMEGVSKTEQRPSGRPAQAARHVPVPAKAKPVSLDFDDESDDD